VAETTEFNPDDAAWPDNGDAALDAALAATDESMLTAINSKLDLAGGMARILRDQTRLPTYGTAPQPRPLAEVRGSREDAFLTALIPQAAEHLAEQHAGSFNIEVDQTRFLTWLAAHTEQPADAKTSQAELHLAEPASGRSATPVQIIGELLTSHPAAASLLAEASHRRALAVTSARSTPQKSAKAHTARLNYETLRHRLDPRCRRTVNFGTGLVALVVLAASIFLGLLPIALHGFGLGPGWLTVWGPARENAVSGSLVSILILGLAAGGAALISHMEPASLLLSRRRWYRVRAVHEAALRLEQEDREAEAAATEAWLALVRAHASSAPGSSAHAVQETTALAAALLSQGARSFR